MMKKKILLSALVLLPTSALLIAEDEMVSTTIHYNEITEATPQAISSALFQAEPEENDFLIEQQFICEQEGQGEGVVCQMYECINNDCKVATPIKVTSGDQKLTTVTITEEKPESTDLTESKEKEPQATNSTESDMVYTGVEKFIPTDLNESKALAPSEALVPEEEQETVTPEKTEINESIVTRVKVLPHDYEEIQELKYEIRNAERMCERAETDPREKAICEAASARVQWKKEKIRALENFSR